MNDDFKKKYREEMDRQFPSAESLKSLEDAMGRASRKSKAVRIRSLVALAACFALIVAFSGPIMNLISKQSKKIEVPTVAGSYEELYTLLSELRTENNKNTYALDVWFGAHEAAAAPERAASATDSSKGLADIPEFSDTNLQVAGVQEADIVKTDGRYIYALSSEYLYIVSAVDGKLQKVSQIVRNVSDEQNRKGKSSLEMYVRGDRLIVLTNYYSYYPGPWGAEPALDVVPEKRAYILPYFGASEVGVEIYDISDRANPRQLSTLSQSGSYVSSRMIGDIVYLVSNQNVYDIAKDKPETYVPQVFRNGEGSLIEAKDICIAIAPEYLPSSAQYLIVSGIDTSGSGEIVSTKSILGYGSTVYSSKDNLYVAAYSQLDSAENKYSDATKLYRFSLNSGRIEFEAEGIVPGTIINQFAMDEHNGTFRIVTTVYSYTYSDGRDGDIVWRSVTDSEQHNALYTLDLNLNLVGKIENLAPDERVYSVRFIGDTAYFVTFRQVDPLFAVDLSDPANPVILSKLKIPGFSEYLHPFAEGLLFGLGKDADEESGKVGFLKLSMFDISNPSDVTETDKLIIDGTFYSEASYNHKAILIDSEKNIIAFPADGKYYIYSYSRDNGFMQKAVISLVEKENDYYYYYYELRGLYIGDYLYVVSDRSISSYSMETYKLHDTLKLSA